MAKKGGTAAKSATSNSRTARGRAVSFSGSTNGRDLDDDIEEDELEDTGEADIDVMQMMQELQKQKAAQSSARSAAFQTKKAALFKAAKKDAEVLVRDGCAYLDQTLETIDSLREQETSFEARLGQFTEIWKVQENTASPFLTAYRPNLQKLSQNRADVINAGSTSAESFEERRKKSRVKIEREAKAYVEDNLENKKVALEASAYIRHFKALLSVSA